MKQSDDHNSQNAIELEDELARHVSALKSEQLTEVDYQKMESNLQRMIIAKGNREEQKIVSHAESHASPQSKPLQQKETTRVNQLKTFFSRVFSWQPLPMASSMGAITAIVLTVVFMGAPTRTAFAAVLSEMQLVSSMIYSSRIESSGMHLMDIKVFHRVPDQLRIETLPQGSAKEGAMINVMHLDKGKGMLFFPGRKIATPFNFDASTQSPSAKDDPLYWYEQLQDYQGEPVEYLVEENINGVLAEGFVIKENGAKITVWASVRSHLPVKLIVTLDEINDEVPFKMVASLKYNQVLNDSLFSLKIADGYKVANEEEHQN